MPLPLKNIRVLDIGHVWAGPRAARWPADMGAQVIKVESTSRYDSLRGSVRPASGEGKFVGQDPGSQPYNRSIKFHQVNLNKLGIALNLQTSRGKDLFKRLAKISDVVLDNFSFGVMDKLGLGYQVLSEINPALIMMSMPAFGGSGPERDYLAFGVTQEPLSGLLGLTGYRNKNGPYPSGAHHGDPTNANHAVGAILAALWARRRTGKVSSSISVTSSPRWR